MNRRQFLRVTMGLALSGALQYVIHPPAQALAVPSPRKGMCANNLPTVDSLHSAWLREDFAYRLWNERVLHGTARYLVDISAAYTWQYLTVPNIKAMLGNPGYCGKWLLLNEPDLTGLTPSQAAAQVKTLKALVLKGDPQARFIVSIGTHIHPIWGVNSWGKRLLALLDLTSIDGFHTHIYPNPNITLIAYLSKVNQWRNSAYPKMQLWLTEIGNPTALSNPNYMPAKIDRLVADYHFMGWFWFAQYPVTTETTRYLLLQNANGSLTPVGQAYATL